MGGSAAKIAGASVVCPCASGNWYVRVSSCVSVLCEAVLSRPVRDGMRGYPVLCDSIVAELDLMM